MAHRTKVTLIVMPKHYIKVFVSIDVAQFYTPHFRGPDCLTSRGFKHARSLIQERCEPASSEYSVIVCKNVHGSVLINITTSQVTDIVRQW